MNTKRAFLTFDVNADKGISLGQSTTVEDLLSASRVMDLSSMTSLKAISSVWSWNEAGGVGEGLDHVVGEVAGVGVHEAHPAVLDAHVVERAADGLEHGGHAAAPTPVVPCVGRVAMEAK